MNLYQRVMERLAATKVGASVFRRLATAIDRRVIRWSKGRVSSGLGTTFGKRILLMTAKGAKSGKERTVPLLFTRHGRDFIVVASKAGEPDNPAWYFNVRANPSVEVEVDGEKFSATAREVDGDERAKLWKIACDGYPGYEAYQARVDRRIPVVLLERAS